MRQSESMGLGESWMEVVPRKKMPWGTFAQFVDPDENEFILGLQGLWRARVGAFLGSTGNAARSLVPTH